MTVKEFKELLSQVPDDFEVYTENPGGSEDYFVEGIRLYPKKGQVFIETSG